MQMPFGKYKGCEIENLSTDYLDWLLSEVDLRPWLKPEVERVYQARLGFRPETQPPACPDLDMARQLLRAGVQSLAKRYHPDVGGTNEEMKRVNAAREWFARILGV